MSTSACPKCLQPKPVDRDMCRLCAAIEQGLIKGLAEREAERMRQDLNNTAELTYEEAGLFDTLVEGFEFVLADTPFYRGTTYDGPPIDPRTLLPDYVPNTPGTPTFADGTPVPAGYGSANIGEVRGAIDAERQRKALEANAAWMAVEEQALAAHHERQARQSNSLRRDVLTAAILGGLAGFAIGFGLLALILILTGGLA